MRRIILRLAITILLLASWLTGSSVMTAQSQAQTQNPIYLIVAPDIFTEELAGFISLQQTRSFEVRTIWLSLPYPSDDVHKASIKAAIQNQIPRPKYVLLIGDDEWIPTWLVTLSTTALAQTDLLYTTFDGPSDYVPNTILGRLPVHSEGELVAYLTKLAAYYQIERYPDWMKQISFVASDDVTIVDSIEAKFEGIISTFTAPNGYTGSFLGRDGLAAPTLGGDRLFPTAYHATVQDILAVMDEGRVALVFAGKGSPTTFIWKTKPGLDTDDVSLFDGPEVLPLVAAFAPQTADYSATLSMADAWILNPTSGALTYLGATENTYDEMDLDLAEGVFRGLFASYSTPLSIGEAFQAGMEFFTDVRDGYEEEYYKIYQLFGDPSLTIRFPEGALLTAPFSRFIAPWGGTVTLPVTIKNVGPTEETFKVLIDSNCDYPIINNPNPFDLTLSAGSGTVILVTIQIVTDYPAGTSDIITITATKESDEIIKSALTITSQVFKPSVFLPVIHR